MRLSRLSTWPLRAQLVAFLLVVSLLPVAVLAVLEVREAHRRIFESETALLGARADQLTGELDAFHLGYRRAVARFAAVPDVLEFLRSAPDERDRRRGAMVARLHGYEVVDPAIRGVSIIAPDLRVAVATEPALDGRVLDDRRYLRDALSGTATISDVFVSDRDAGDAATIAYLCPARGADGQVLGAVVVWVRAEALWDLARRANGKAGAGSFAVIFDRDGIRIAHTYSRDIVFHPGGALAPALVERLVDEQRFGPRTRELLGDVRSFPQQFERARAEAPDPGLFDGLAPVNQQINYGVGRRLGLVPWTVFYMVPEVTMLAPVERATHRRLLFAALVAFAALLAGAGFARMIAAPVDRLTAATERLARGEPSVGVDPGGSEELATLGASFNSMASEVSQSRAGLEAEVAQRTAELRDANDALRKREQKLVTTLHSIGDAVITTDDRGRITRMNPVAEQLTGWTADAARGVDLREVFRIINEGTREPTESPVERVLRDGRIVGLANHTVLISRDGIECPIADSAAPIRDPDGGVQGVVLVFRDVRAQRETELALIASERRFRDLYENSPDMHVTVDTVNYLITDCNQTLCRRVGYDRAELLGRPFHVLYESYDLASLPSLARKLVELGDVTDVERVMRCKDGTIIDASLSLRAMRGSDGGVIEFRAVWRDITGRKQAERDRQFLVGLPDILRSSTEVAAILFAVSTQLAKYLGASRCAFAEIDLGDDTSTIERDYHGEQASLAGVRPLSAFGRETVEQARRGATVVLHDTASDPRTAASYREAYAPLGLAATLSVPLLRAGLWITTLVVASSEPRTWQDREVALVKLVAERVWGWVEQLRVLDKLREHSVREAEQLTEARLLRVRQDELARNLKEREVLLQEVHHRVKNNLQVISSLINMQVRRLEPGPSRDALDECQMRVLAIALIHEKLYQSRDYSEVQFAEYARSLAASVFHTLGVSRSDVALELAIDDIPLGVDRAIPCGLVLNELVTNALKHAFPAGRKGTIRVVLARLAAGRIRLAVEDDGRGLPEGFDIHAVASMGSQLICTLAEQLDAELEVIRGNGATFQLTFSGPAAGAGPR